MIGHFLSLNTSCSCYDTTFFFWFCGLPESVLHLLLALLPVCMPPACALGLLLLCCLSQAPIHLELFNWGRWFPTLPFWRQHPGESQGAA